MDSSLQNDNNPELHQSGQKEREMKETPQLALWKGAFGNEYAKRDANALPEMELSRLRRNWGQMLGRAISPAPGSALEVGANIGRNLVALDGLIGSLAAIEPNEACCEQMRSNPLLGGVTVHQGSSFALPYDESSVDLVFTSGVLIHIAPDDLLAATDEIVRVARHYVICIEYFSRTPCAVPYRDVGNEFLFKRDFGSWYLDHYPQLEIVDYGFLWSRVDSGDDLTWWLFKKN